MKRNFLFMSVLASMFLVGCSQEVITQNGESDGDGKGETHYLSVNIMSSDGSTRAADGYEDGSPEENTITKIRFYFFTEEGEPTPVKLQGTKYVNYYDWEPETEGDNKDQIKDPINNDDIESTLKQATIVINTKDGDKLPQRIVALLNPTEETPTSTRTLKELKDIANDYAQADLTTEGKFVMFNSVYAKDGVEACAVPILKKNLQKTEADAQKAENAVKIYVERNVAKVSVEKGIDDELALKDKIINGNPIIVNGKQVYLKINNWCLTANTDMGRLGKKINPNWEENSWLNNSAQHRSCWAINSSEAGNKYYTYTDINQPITTSLYTNENAANYTYTDENGNNKTKVLNKTKVILSGTLGVEVTDEEGNTSFSPLTIVRHLGAHFADTYSKTESENLPELKKNILAQLNTNNYSFYFGDEKNRTQIGTDDIQIVITDQEAKEESKNNCYVYAQLTEEAQKKTWYDTDKSANEGETTPTIAYANINKALKENVDKALVWREGMTYYYYEIIHNGTGENATKGVVRNHIYKTKVTAIAGLGTPVYDPDQKIYPEKPDPNDHYIAAQINILSWHIVQNNYELEW